MTKKILTFVATMMVIGLSATYALADTFTLNNPNAALINQGTGGGNTFGTVTATLAGGVMHVEFQMDPGYTIKTNIGGGGSVGFQVTGANFAISNILGNTGGANFAMTADLGLFNGDPVPNTPGTWDVLVKLKPTVDPGVSFLSFDVSGVTALTPELFFAHVVKGSGSTAITGFVGTGPYSTPAPEPASLVLLGTGLMGLGSAVRKRINRPASEGRIN